MPTSTEFTIGVMATCTDGVCGRLAQVVINPVKDDVTHLIVEPEHRSGLGRLVPVELVEAADDDELRLKCTREEFGQLEMAEQIRFLPGTEGYGSYDPTQVLLWPYFGGNQTPPVAVDTLPPGEVAVRRGEEVLAADGRIGEVEGLIVDTQTHHVTHVLLKEGHLFDRKDVTIPITSVAAVGEDGIRLSMSKQEVGALPAVEFHRPR